MSSFPNWFEQQLNLIKFQPSTVLVSVFSLFIVYKLISALFSPKKNLPPSPPKLPVLGNLLQLGTHPHRSLQALAKQHGDLMSFNMGSAPYIVVSSAKVASEVLKTNDVAFSSRELSKTDNKLLYNSKALVAAPYGDYWKQMRSVCVVHLLSSKSVRSFHGIREEESSLVMERISNSGSSPVDMSDVFQTYTTSMIFRVAFGRSSSRKGKTTNHKQLLKEMLQSLTRFNIGDFIPWLGWINHFNGWNANISKVIREVDQFFEEIIIEHEEDIANKKSKQVKDIVDVLLELQKDNKEGFRIERDSIKGILLDCFAGGTDTTYTTLEWTMTELLRHPRVMQKLQEEVRGVTEGKRRINEDDLEKLKYLKVVIKETLRLHPPTPVLLPRQSIQDTKVQGYDIPSKTSVLVNAWAIQRDPAVWEDPDTFYPERFFDCSVDFRGQDFELIPFGSGRRVCPGIMFATTNVELIISNLMNKFDWVLPGGAKPEDLDMTEQIGLTAHRKIPLLAIASVHNFE